MNLQVTLTFSEIKILAITTIPKKIFWFIIEKIEFGFSADAVRRKSRRLASHTYIPSGAYLVLQLHDELIYEVCITKTWPY